MAGRAANHDLISQLNILSEVGVVRDLGDAELLRRFLAGRDSTSDAAFTALVERHGPMVLRVCRKVLGETEDADDAFQATFLVLARKAASVRKANSVASWLHGVARRIAVRARIDASRRKVYEQRGAAMNAARIQDEVVRPDEWADLHLEIDRLPTRYREPILLCYFEGLTSEAAAGRLGCPQNTLLSRLSRARERLRRRLSRRGLALPAVSPSGALWPEPATTPPPPRLVEIAVRASLAFARGQAGDATLISSTVAALARERLNAMMISKLKSLAALALCCVGSALFFGTAGPRIVARAGDERPRPKGEAPARPRSAGDVLDDVRARIEANRKAARTVSLRGRVSVTRKLITAAVDPSKSNESSRRGPFEIKGPFRFVAYGWGRRKRWDKTYEPKGFGVDEVRALDGDVVRDATNRMRGYLRPAGEFLPTRADNVDFYRDHWFSEDVEPLDKIIGFMKDHPDKFGVRTTPDGLIRVTGPAHDGREIDLLGLDPGRGGMVAFASTSGGEFDMARWSWKQDAGSGIWYPAQLSRWFRPKYLDGSVWSELIVLEVEEATFNEPVPPETFTFAGLGLAPGARVVDMRTGDR